MTKRLSHNLYTIGLYSICMLVLIIIAHPVTYAIILGFFAGLFNDMITELRKLNGETFKNLEEEKSL